MKKLLAGAMAALLLLSGCRSVPGIVDVTAPPLPTATVLPTATPMTISAQEKTDLSDYSDLALTLLAEDASGETTVLCVPALVTSLYSLYWAGGEESRAQLEDLLGLSCTRESLCVNGRDLLQGAREMAPDLDLWLRIYAGAGISLHETATGVFPEYFDTSLVLADLTGEAWSRDLQEDMALATGGRLSRDLSAYVSAPGQTILLSCAAYDVRWQEAFDDKRDKLDTFTTLSGEKMAVNTLRSFSDHEIFRAQAGTLAVLPMEGDLECWAILPREGLSIRELLEQADMEEFIRWRSQAHKEAMGVAIPELDLDTEQDFTPHLRDLGLTQLSAAVGQYETIGRGFAGADVVLQASRLRFLHEAAPDAPVPSPTPASQVITKPREPDMLSFDRESLFLLVDPTTRGILYAVALRTV